MHELGLGKSVDTLGRWVAHYLAELLVDAERAEPTDTAAKDRCVEGILKIWMHRHALPDGSRPFQNLEPVQRALESLDPEANHGRHFRHIRQRAGAGEPESRVQQWLTLADELDYSAKVLIKHCLVQAASSELDRTREWVALAEAAGIDDGPDTLLIRIVSSDAELLEDPGLDDIARKTLMERIERLEAFRKSAGSLVKTLKRQLTLLE